MLDYRILAEVSGLRSVQHLSLHWINLSQKTAVPGDAQSTSHCLSSNFSFIHSSSMRSGQTVVHLYHGTKSSHVERNDNGSYLGRYGVLKPAIASKGGYIMCAALGERPYCEPTEKYPKNSVTHVLG